MNSEPELSPFDLLRHRFGHASFRPGQAEIVNAVLEGRDVLGVMPTGSGKSLGYVLPAMILPAPVLVVSPLIALMKDQVDQLGRKGIAAAYVNSTVPAATQRNSIAEFRAGRLKLLFVAPERFRSVRFMEALGGFRPGLFAIDEAHCISEWGHDFRPDYARLREPAIALGRPPILALTATATRAVRDHIVENLAMRSPLVIVRGFDRPNLDFEVQRFSAREDKLDQVLAIAQELRRGIVYCATRKSVEEVTNRLRLAKIDAAAYHAGLPDVARGSVSERFATGRLPVVVATNAFGMGIDRPDLRFVVHFETPGSIEAYTQEAGRAGRDGLPARCVLLHSAQDARLQRFFIDTSYPEPWVIEKTARAVESACAKSPSIAESEIAGNVPGVKHPREIDSALRILAEAGTVTREYDPESRSRRARFVGHMAIDHRTLARRADAERERLADMLDYAERGGCRRARIVDYFAGSVAAASCGACSGCRASDSRRDATDEQAEVVREILSMVETHNGRYGRKKLAGILSGSRAREILESRLDRSPHYGRLSHLGATRVDALMQECVDLELLTIEGGEYPVLALGYRGREALRGREPIRVAPFTAPPRRPATRQRETRSQSRRPRS